LIAEPLAIGGISESDTIPASSTSHLGSLHPCCLHVVQATQGARAFPQHILPPAPVHPHIPPLALPSIASSYSEPVDPHILLLASLTVTLPTPAPCSSLPYVGLPIDLGPPLRVLSPSVVVSPPFRVTSSLAHRPGLVMSDLLPVLYVLGFLICNSRSVSCDLMYLVFRLSALRSLYLSSRRSRVASPSLPTGLATCLSFTSCPHPRSFCASMSCFRICLPLDSTLSELPCVVYNVLPCI
jgi:hypothetical protein